MFGAELKQYIVELGGRSFNEGRDGCCGRLLDEV